MRFTFGVFAVILSYTWLLEPRMPRSYVAVPAAIVMILGFSHAWRTGEWGFRREALAPGLRAAALFTLPLVCGMLLAGAARGTLHDRRDPLSTLGGLIVWGAAQQWILQTLVLRESQRTTSRRLGVLLAAVLFGAVHLPNPFLSAVTFVGALGWCVIYDRHPNVLPLALSHAVGTLAILYAFDDGLTGRLRIGQAYLD